MKTSSKSTSCSAFKIFTFKNGCGENTLWMNLHGASFTNLARTPKQAKDMARQLRETAKWVETQGVEYLRA